jgi:hypothetical protein
VTPEEGSNRSLDDVHATSGHHRAAMQLDLLGGGMSSRASDALRGQEWPLPERFPINRPGHHVRDIVWSDIVESTDPLLVTGYASLAQLVELLAAWDDHNHSGKMRLVLGAEPFASNRVEYRSDRKEFSAKARRYWLEEEGVSLRLSAKVIQAIEVIDGGKLEAKFVHGSNMLHAKIYVGDTAATSGSSNFTHHGLVSQLEANTRFEAVKQADRRRYLELRSVAENYWAAGKDWNEELRALLGELLRVVPWKEALARACAELLTGSWAERYLQGANGSGHALWPSQTSGIAEALWVMESVGSVLIADATGSGKTRMGAHLVRAARDRLWSTGRVRHDLTVLVGPPAVIKTWEHEALSIGMPISTVSHGLLSRANSHPGGREELAVKQAQILAIDEAHNFLNAASQRTKRVRDSLADNVMLFTATPISRGATDILNLVGLLGPDNFDDATLRILNRLDARRGSARVLSNDENATIRREIQRFTVRRTKSQLNEMVELDEASFLDPTTGRVSRYPRHITEPYRTAETNEDSIAADRIRTLVEDLLGIAQLEKRIFVPKGFNYTDEQWLRFRTMSATGLARYHVLEALRSSRAALLEHLSGTASAAEHFGLALRFKPADTGDVLAKIERRAEEGPPEIQLGCRVDEWLDDPKLWVGACADEYHRYEQVLRESALISDAREQGKVALLIQQFERHGLVLAFDHSPITLALLESLLVEPGMPQGEVIFATSNKKQKEEVMARFSIGGSGNAIAVCSDAMNEGLNLQRSSCIVHLDLPTTLRVAEQRVGRIDRMNSPHDEIESWWPDDGPSFATRAYERLMHRAKESAELLGSNLQLPEFERHATDKAIVTAESQIMEFEESKPTHWDGICDALDPVRQLIAGDDAVIDAGTYAAFRESRERVLSLVSPVESRRPWAFFSVAAIAHGAPRWILIDGIEVLTDLDEVATRLRQLLKDDPPDRALDDAGTSALERFLDIAASAERNLLPRKMLRALQQMEKVTAAWAKGASGAKDEIRATEWREVGRLASREEQHVDPYQVAERWLGLIAPTLDRFRSNNRRARYIVLRDIEPDLIHEPFSFEDVAHAFEHMPIATPLDQRVSACILGVPAAR